MATKFVNPPGLYDPSVNGYSHIGVVEHPKKMVFIAGQGGEASDGSLPGTFSGQVKNALSNLRVAIDAADCALDEVVKINTYIVDYDESKLAEMNKHLVQFFTPSLPTQTLVPVPRLALDGMLFEIDATLVQS